MSNDDRRPVAQAEEIAAYLRGQIAYPTCTHWLECGSIRRRLKDIGDIEIVCIPKIHTDGRSKLWIMLDVLRDEGRIIPGVTDRAGKTTAAWGDTYRKFTLNDWHFDIFTATPDNYWLQVVIRTGNHIFSQRLMSAIKRQGVYRIGGGYIRPYFEKRGDFEDEPKRGLTDKGIGELPIIPAESEEHVLSLAGRDYMIGPQQRSWADR